MTLQSGAITAEISGALMPKSDTARLCRRIAAIKAAFKSESEL
jgi:hypothetical protein